MGARGTGISKRKKASILSADLTQTGLNAATWKK
jgi:hypothetical protein